MNNSHNNIIKSSIAFFLLPVATYFYQGYKKSNSPSTFEQAADNLGFKGYKKGSKIVSAKEHQEALLNILQMSGYFTPTKLWQGINALNLKDPEIVFNKLYSAIKKSKADQNFDQFNPKILRKNFGKGSGLDEQDMKDLLLYLSQNAFNRKIGQERNELTSLNWMQEHEEEFNKAAEVLKLIDRHEPSYQEYDTAWIAGASRVGLLARIIDYKFITSKYSLTFKENPIVLAGARELWANLDGISPTVLAKLEHASSQITDMDLLDASVPVGENNDRIEEGKSYIPYLAKKNKIKLDEQSPLIEYKTEEECPKGRMPGRIYPNYADGEQNRLTETTMSYDLIEKYLPNSVVIDSHLGPEQRPNTATTARDAGMNLVQKIQEGEYAYQKELIILFVSNNPYIERQTIVSQREVNKILKALDLDSQGYSIKLDGVGFKSKQDVVTVHSESAALFAERYKDACDNSTCKRPIETLLFQTRDTTPPTDIPEEFLDTPTYWDMSGLSGLFQDAWDLVLP
ncbi:hypothetical protein phytr_6480 [Candidatus Phycorickettsia trachydisci]|uniref:Uncharacterized protein n=1 Tax=Candidatus Phycorickettsia trachydisci TaxID=2115978 RepID=A0A2P1P8I9_9RICK|nr:hypothetical protein [Candidatus Phycorickettsia trachydisci]AVP87589.1 hypothetical protein phytr_6480 [Candidatus Phycorickettsia trachydisci]